MESDGRAASCNCWHGHRQVQAPLEGKNPIGAADLEWIFARNCEGTEQLQ